MLTDSRHNGRNGKVTWKQLGILLGMLGAILLSLGGIVLANRVTCAENKTRAESMGEQLNRMDKKLDTLLMR